MRTLILAAVLAFPAIAYADDASWQKMNGAEISATLTDKALDYGAAWSEFRASGRTLYNAGHDSWGYWEVRGDQYCSMWPPSDLWACYDMARKGNVVRFIGASGETTDGVYKDAAE